jgi:two-component system chemotaxis response regulator CheY
MNNNGPIDLLIVDDSAGIRKILQRVLRQTDLSLGHIYEASDGRQALEVLRQNSVSVVMSDINMPNMDGIELLRTLRSAAEWKSLPVMMITTEGSQLRVLEAAELGATCYVRKPFTTDQIRDKLNALLSAAKTRFGQ